MSQPFDWVRATYAAELQANIDAVARGMLERHGRLAVAVICHPSQIGAELIRGFCVILDPRQEPGKVELR